MTTTRVMQGSSRGTVQLHLEMSGRDYWKLAAVADASGVDITTLLLDAVAGKTRKTSLEPVARVARVRSTTLDRAARVRRIRVGIAAGRSDADIARDESVTSQAVNYHRNKSGAETASGPIAA